MKRVFVAISLVLALTMGLTSLVTATTYHTITVDGAVSDWAADELVSSSSHSGGGTGTDIQDLYVTWDADNLYLGLTTNNTTSESAAYGFSFDVDQVSGSGYSGGSFPLDALYQLIGFGNPYLPEYQLYFRWNSEVGMQTPEWWHWETTTSSWTKLMDLPSSAYGSTGTVANGLQTFEAYIPWTNIVGTVSTLPQRVKICAWVAGGWAYESSAVDTIPPDGNVVATAVNPNEIWDTDTLGKSWEVYVDLSPNDGAPDSGVSPNQGELNTAVTLSRFAASLGEAWVVLPVAAVLAAGLTGGYIWRRRRQ